MAGSAFLQRDRLGEALGQVWDAHAVGLELQQTVWVMQANVPFSFCLVAGTGIPFS